MNPLLIAIMVVQLLAVPPLTREQQEQLKTATDSITTLDEAALYPLLFNAMTWKGNDEAGSTVPDYKALHDNPEASRGQLCLIEGVFYRSKPDRLSRPGPWDGHLEQWSISPDQSQVVVVYLVNGPPEKDEPRVGQKVRLVARFYKVWMDKDRNGDTRPYLVFVGNSAKVVPTGDEFTFQSPNPIGVVVVLLILSFTAVTLFRFFSNRALARRRLARLEAAAEQEEIDDEIEENQEPLPDDPAAALAEMERRRQKGGGDV